MRAQRRAGAGKNSLASGQAQAYLLREAIDGSAGM